jgi:hypothetical protein
MSNIWEILATNKIFVGIANAVALATVLFFLLRLLRWTTRFLRDTVRTNLYNAVKRNRRRSWQNAIIQAKETNMYISGIALNACYAVGSLVTMLFSFVVIVKAQQDQAPFARIVELTYGIFAGVCALTALWYVSRIYRMATLTIRVRNRWVARRRGPVHRASHGPPPRSGEDFG